MATRYCGNATIRATYDPALQGTGDYHYEHGAWRVTVSAEGRVRWRGVITQAEIRCAARDGWTGKPKGEQSVYTVAMAHATADDVTRAREHVRGRVEQITIAPTRTGERATTAVRWRIQDEPDTYTDPPAFGAMLAAAAARGLPKSCAADLHVHDRRWVAQQRDLASGQPFVFAWSLRTGGTHTATDARHVETIDGAFSWEEERYWYVWTGHALRETTATEAAHMLREEDDAREVRARKAVA